MNWSIENLNPSHRVKAFSSGERDLDRWLARFAAENDRRRLCKVRVAVRPGEWDVLGFYCLSGFSVESARMTPAENGRFPNYPIPCILLGQLATDQRVQGQGLGKFLLMHALHSCLRSTEEVGAYALITHALHERAKAFYLKYDFTPFADEPLHLMMHMRQLAERFNAPTDD